MLYVKRLLGCLFLCLYTTIISAQYTPHNRALKLDGKDNNVCTGIGVIKAPWTLEVWIKPDSNLLKDTAVIIGGGEYSTLNTAHNLPLIFIGGKIGNPFADIWSEAILDEGWHHIALSCNGEITQLYIDGHVVAKKLTSFSIIPGTLGSHLKSATVYKGLMDEVRIWNAAVDESEIQYWMKRPLNNNHPNFKSLVAYYNFDDGINEIGINWVGKSWQTFHLRNGRIHFRGRAPLASTVPSNNIHFKYNPNEQPLFNAVILHNEWDYDQHSKNFQILKLRIILNQHNRPAYLTGITLDLSEVSWLPDIERLQIFHSYSNGKSDTVIQYLGRNIHPKKKISLTNKQKRICLSPGVNYITITADIARNTTRQGRIKIKVPEFSLNETSYVPEEDTNPIIPELICNSKPGSQIIKVLQWNIWHGGIHLGNDGMNKVIEVLKAANADIITMQEAYGSQQQIADALGYYMYSVNSKENLAVYSRYKITPLPQSHNTFNSNPVLIHLSNGRTILVNSCWLRYSNDPEYTSIYPNTGQNPELWVAGDSAKALKDIQNIIEKDTKPYLDREDLIVILAGDFNSASHLDWTKAATSLHFGYGPVHFPVSRYLLKEGYKDSFREIHPDEVKRPEGTWSPIYGQLPHCRIDFIYYKGKGIKPIGSKIIRTHPNIDNLWPSDHAAVLTSFEIADKP